MNSLINPIVTYNDDLLYPGEIVMPLNPYTNKGYIINPFYYVTNMGRIFSMANGKFSEKKLQMNTSGYLEVKVSTTNDLKHLLIHRAVLSTFAPVPNIYELDVDHEDGDHLNNNLSNLSWKTNTENIRSAIKNGITPPRTRYITDANIIQIMDLVNKGYTDDEISEMIIGLKVAPQTVRIIRTGRAIYGEVLKKLGIEPVFNTDRSILTNRDYDLVCNLYRKGEDLHKIAEISGIKYRTVRGIILRKFGTKEQRSDLDNLTIQHPKSNKTSPISSVPDKFKDIEMYPVNIYTSPLHVIEPYYYVTKNGRIFSMARGDCKEIRPTKNSKGYEYIGLSTNHGIKPIFVHRIVLSTFNPVDNMYELEVNHKNTIHDDNNLDNLEWSTHLENVIRTANSYDREPQRAPDEDIIKIHKLVREGNSDEQVSNIMNNKYSANNVKIIRLGQKTYGPVLEKLGLKPYKYQNAPLNLEVKYAIYTYIESKLGTKGLMELYDDAGEKFNISSKTARAIYSDFRNKKIK